MKREKKRGKEEEKRKKRGEKGEVLRGTRCIKVTYPPNERSTCSPETGGEKKRKKRGKNKFGKCGIFV